MGWAKFDDQFTDHPKVVAAGPMAELLAMRAVIHCARYETDGHVQAAQLPRLSLGITSTKKQVAALVAAGLWEECDDGWVVHDFLDYHPSKAEQDEKREQARERMANHRKNKNPSSDSSSPDVRANEPRSAQQVRLTPAPAPAPKVKNSAPDKPPPASRKPDEVWDAVIASCGYDPKAMTSSARGAINKAVADLKSVSATPEQIAARARAYRIKWPETSLTAPALAKHWAQLTDKPAKGPPAGARQPEVGSDEWKAREAEQRAREERILGGAA